MVTFSEKLLTYLDAYGLASEHEHSNCILLAKRSKFFIDGKWNTWIDYEKYHELIQRFYQSEGKWFSLNELFSMELNQTYFLKQARKHLPLKITELSRRIGPCLEVQSAGLILRRTVGTASNLKKMLVDAKK